MKTVLKKIIFIFILFFIIDYLNILLAENISHRFMWNLKKGERIESVKTADIEYYENGILKRTYKERNIIDLTVIAIAPDGGFRVSGVFKVFRKMDNESIFQLNEQYSSDFIIRTNGRFVVPRGYFMPNVRHIPTFPDDSVEITGSWTSEAEEIIRSESSKNINMILSSDYLFAGIETNDNGDTNALVQYHIMIDKDLAQAGLKGVDYPDRIYGFNYGTFLWDMKKNIPVSQTERYQILFGFGRDRKYASIDYKMNIISSYKVYDSITKTDEDKNRKKLEEELEDNGDVTVESVPEGLVLRLGEILFDTDSYSLKPESKLTLDSIMKAVKDTYPDREIIVEGHTDNTGEKSYNMTLSKRRAKSVADYIHPSLDHDKISYKGYGDEKPISSNETKDGRQKNRRVDIVIKLR